MCFTQTNTSCYPGMKRKCKGLNETGKGLLFVLFIHCHCCAKGALLKAATVCTPLQLKYFFLLELLYVPTIDEMKNT